MHTLEKLSGYTKDTILCMVCCAHYPSRSMIVVHTIAIKKADKGLCAVVWDKTDKLLESET